MTWAAEARQRNDAVALASLKAHIANCLRGKGAKIRKANEFLPPAWRIRSTARPQTIEEAGTLVVGGPPPWMKG